MDLNGYYLIIKLLKKNSVFWNDNLMLKHKRKILIVSTKKWVVQEAGHAQWDSVCIIWFKCCAICNDWHIIFVVPVLRCLVATIFVWASFFTEVHVRGLQKGDMWRVALTKTAKSWYLRKHLIQRHRIILFKLIMQYLFSLLVCK